MCSSILSTTGLLRVLWMHRSFVALSSESLTSASSTPQSPCRDENWKNWKRHYKILETCPTISSYLILSLLLQESQNWMSLPGQDLCIFLDPHVASPTAASNDLKSVCCGQSFSVQPVYVNTTSLSHHLPEAATCKRMSIQELKCNMFNSNVFIKLQNGSAILTIFMISED